MARTTRGRPKSRRIFSATPRPFFGHTTDKEVAAQKQKTRKQIRLNETARNSAYAIEQRKKDEAAASARASRRLALESARRLEAASLLPRPSKSRKVKKLSPDMDIEAALAEEERKAAEKEVRNALKKERIAEVARVFRETQKAKKEASLEKKRLKKTKQEQIRLETKYELPHIGNEEKEHFKGLVAEKDAKFYTEIQVDPTIRKLRDPVTKWGNFALGLTPPKVEPKKTAVVPKMSIVMPTAPSRMKRSRAISYTPARLDYKKLVVLGLPVETGKGLLDLREIKRKVFSAVTGAHIFETKPDPVIIGVGKRGNYTGLRKGLFRLGPARADGPHKVYAFVTFPTHEQARRVVEAHRAKPITYKGVPLDIRPSRREDEAIEKELDVIDE